jgi:methionyl-tRNA formyltransferase
VDEGIDTGPIIARREVAVEPVDTGASLFAKLEDAALGLFQDTWPDILSGRAPRTAQDTALGSSHRVADVGRIDEIDPNRTYRAGELIDILRARTFPPHAGAYFRVSGRRVLLSLDLRYAEADEGGGLAGPGAGEPQA